MTLKNNRAPLLSNIKLFALFYHHMQIQPGVTVRKRLRWVLISVALTFDLWPWPFAWTSLLSIVITPENFMMIRWQEHCEKGVTDGWTDARIEVFLQLLGRSRELVAAKNNTSPSLLDDTVKRGMKMYKWVMVMWLKRPRYKEKAAYETATGIVNATVYIDFTVPLWGESTGTQILNWVAITWERQLGTWAPSH